MTKRKPPKKRPPKPPVMPAEWFLRTRALAKEAQQASQPGELLRKVGDAILECHKGGLLARAGDRRIMGSPRLTVLRALADEATASPDASDLLRRATTALTEAVDALQGMRSPIAFG